MYILPVLKTKNNHHVMYARTCRSNIVLKTRWFYETVRVQTHGFHETVERRLQQQQRREDSFVVLANVQQHCGQQQKYKHDHVRPGEKPLSHNRYRLFTQNGGRSSLPCSHINESESTFIVGASRRRFDGLARSLRRRLHLSCGRAVKTGSNTIKISACMLIHVYTCTCRLMQNHAKALY